jgi:hypothetical protein
MNNTVAEFSDPGNIDVERLNQLFERLLDQTVAISVQEEAQTEFWRGLAYEFAKKYLLFYQLYKARCA